MLIKLQTVSLLGWFYARSVLWEMMWQVFYCVCNSFTIVCGLNHFTRNGQKPRRFAFHWKILDAVSLITTYLLISFIRYRIEWRWPLNDRKDNSAVILNTFLVTSFSFESSRLKGKGLVDVHKKDLCVFILIYGFKIGYKESDIGCLAIWWWDILQCFFFNTVLFKFRFKKKYRKPSVK